MLPASPLPVGWGFGKNCTGYLNSKWKPDAEDGSAAHLGPLTASGLLHERHKTLVLFKPSAFPDLC